jgi:Tfp pilus assembly protein FimT
MPATAMWESVTYGNGRFVAVTSGFVGTAAYSDDGINWTKTSIRKDDWYSVTYGNGRFVAAPGNNSAWGVYSDDGINWTEMTMPAAASWRSVTYGNGRFVAVAAGKDTAAYSDDGINWTKTSMPTTANWKSVTYGNGRFVAVTSSLDSIAAYSDDGINWTEISMPRDTWYSVTYGDCKFVVVAPGSIVFAYSHDGINWTNEYNCLIKNEKVVTEQVRELILGDTAVSEQIGTAIESSKADWNQADETAADYIKNKPEIATDEDIMDLLSEIGAVEPVTTSDGSVLTNSTGEIYTL